MINIPAFLDRADAIKGLPGLIEFKGQLSQVVEIAVWMRAHQERNSWRGESEFSCRFHIGQGWLPFHACWSLSPLSGICCSAPKICSSVPEVFLAASRYLHCQRSHGRYLARDWQTGENTCYFSLKASLLPVVRERHRELDRVAASQLCGDADNILNSKQH